MATSTSDRPLRFTCSERSEKNTSWVMLSAARSSRIIAIIASIEASRTGASQSASGFSSRDRPNCCASASPTGFR